jgi:hypothetical protein
MLSSCIHSRDLPVVFVDCPQFVVCVDPSLRKFLDCVKMLEFFYPFPSLEFCNHDGYFTCNKKRDFEVPPCL